MNKRSVLLSLMFLLLSCFFTTRVSAASTEGFKLYLTLQEFEAEGGKIESFSQSPYLDGQDLPPVQERISAEPIVIQPYEEIGVYGGTARVFTKRPSPAEDAVGFIAQEGLLKLGVDDATIVPNLATGYEWADGGKTLTLTLRKGVKWSDGAPFTTEDIRFWYEEVALNQELTPVPPSVWKTQGGFMDLEIVDDVTFRMKFNDPFPLVLNNLAHWGGVKQLLYPSHYLKQFHIKYNEKAGELARENGYDQWSQLFLAKYNEIYQGSISCKLSVNVPTLYAYVMTEKTSDHWIFERNPYYYKVDTEGHQLPYIDRIFVQLASNVELIDAKVISGETDFAIFNTSLANYTMYKKSEKKGGYRVLLWWQPFGAYPLFMFNQTYADDPILREIFADVRFRKAMSVAINRDEINKAMFYGKAVPRAMTVLPTSSFFKPEFEKVYTGYNLDEANAYLDEMGLKWDQNKEHRLRSDSRPLTIIMEFTNIDGGGVLQSIAEMVVQNWAKIGVQVVLKSQSGELLRKRVSANLTQAGLWWGDKVTDMLFPVVPMWFVPYHHDWENSWAPLWGQHYMTDGKEGEEPSAEAKQNLERWLKLKVTVDPDEAIQLGQQILQSNAENLWTIGTVGMPPKPVIVRNNLRNVPERGMTAWDNFWGQNYYPEQRFFKPPLLDLQK